MCNGELRRRAILESEIHGGDRAAARHWGITHGPISRARHGGNSPTLRRLWKIPKHPPLDRLIINNCPPELKAIYDEMCSEYGLSRAELLKDMIAVYNDTMENMPY